MKLKEWQLVLIGALLILGFAVVVHIFKAPDNLAGQIFDFLDVWASAGGPAITLIAVAVALYIGIKSLRQTRDIQKSEKRQRLLSEINDWAELMAESTVKLEKPISSVINDRLSRYHRFLVKSRYMENIAASFEDDLAFSVKRISKLLRFATNFIFKLIKLKEIKTEIKEETLGLIGEINIKDPTLLKYEKLLPEFERVLYKYTTELMVKIADIKKKEV